MSDINSEKKGSEHWKCIGTWTKSCIKVCTAENFVDLGSKITSDEESGNGILLPKLFWPTVRKNCFSDREKLLKFEAEGREFAIDH